MREEAIKKAVEQFETLLREQLVRSDKMEQATGAKDYTKLETIRIGICGGDGIGPVIMDEARRLLEILLRNEVETGKVVLKEIP